MSKSIIDSYKRNLCYYGESFRFIRKLCESSTSLSKTLVRSLRNTVVLKRVTAVKIVNRCVVTGRKTGGRTFLKLSRLEFLRLAREGVLYGLNKRSR